MLVKLKILFSAFKAKWDADCSAIGHFLKKVIARLLGLAAVAQFVIEKVNILPDGFLPQEVKYILGGLAVLSFFYGGMTVKK